MNRNYIDYKITFDECFNEGYRSFDECPRWAQERMAYNYWLSLDTKERIGFLQYIEEQIMDIAANSENILKQADLEDLLIDYFCKDIESRFNDIREQAA